MKTALWAIFLALGASYVHAEEVTVISLRDFCSTELKCAGLEVKTPVRVHITALGGGGDYGWTYKSDVMFAYGWIIDADTRKPVWGMQSSNTSKTGDDREFDGEVSLEPGSYEVYFCAYGFAYHTTFTHILTNVDRRSKPFFGVPTGDKKGISSWFKGWWSDDIQEEWEKRCSAWGIDIAVDASSRSSVTAMTAPRQRPMTVLAATRLGDRAVIRQAFTLTAPLTMNVYAVGEGSRGGEPDDFGWIVNTRDRRRVWDMTGRSAISAGGARKNLMVDEQISLDKGEYVLYVITDDSHSFDDWNEAPPYDPFSWGVTLSVTREADAKKFVRTDYQEIQNVIVRMTRVGDDAALSEGFTLKESTPVRIYAIGERSNERRQMADYATIIDGRTRNRVWSMDVDRTYHAGGAPKNRYIDEIVTLPKGSYVVTYTTDDSHAFGAWNMAAPFDQENYGVTVMGASPGFSPAVVGTYVEERDKSVISQITRVGDNADLAERFTLDRTTRVRIYAIGEGQNREMYDYGWIENARTGGVVWEMTYSMTFHAGGGRKNRSVNTTVLLEKGNYVLHYRSDDSHSFGKWNVEPPDDQQYWGITLHREEGIEPGVPAVPPVAPVIPPPIRAPEPKR